MACGLSKKEKKLQIAQNVMVFILFAKSEATTRDHPDHPSNK